MEVAMRSSVSFGREKTNYASSVQDVYVPMDRQTFLSAKGDGQADLLNRLRETHFVLGDNQTKYTTTNKMRTQNGKRGDSKSGTQYGELLVSNLSLGQEKVNYTSAVQSQYHTFGAESMAKPSRDIAIKLMAGSQLTLGDDMPDYISESKDKFVPESSMMAVSLKNSEEKEDPLAQNGRAQPLSSVMMGRYAGKWESGSIGAAPDPTMHKDYKPYKGRQTALVNAYKSNMILGDEQLDYKSTSGSSQEYLGAESSWNTKKI
jgi:hypothetical protein